MSVLVRGLGPEIDAMTATILGRGLGLHDTTFMIADELIGCPVDLAPHAVDRTDKGLGLLIWHKNSCVPPGAPVDHVKDDVRVMEQKVTFNLVVERVW